MTTSKDAGLIHSIIMFGALVLAKEVGKAEAYRLSGLLENAFVDTLASAKERKAYWKACDERVEAMAVKAQALDRPGHEREFALEAVQ